MQYCKKKNTLCNGMHRALFRYISNITDRLFNQKKYWSNVKTMMTDLSFSVLSVHFEISNRAGSTI